MSQGGGNHKASEQFRERWVSRYFSAVRDLAQPGVDVTDPSLQSTVKFTPRASADTALNAFAQLLLLRLNVSHALISLIDSTHQYVLAEAAQSAPSEFSPRSKIKSDDDLWVGSVVLPKEAGICSVLLPNKAESASYRPQDKDLDPDVVVIDDLQGDSRFCKRPFVVDGPRMRWYAGAPIRSSDGIKVGAVCVFDAQPKYEFLEEDWSFLCETARTVMNHLEAGRIQAEFQRRDRLIEGLDSFVSGLSELTNQRAEGLDGAHASRNFMPSTGSNASSMRSLTMWEAALPSGCKQMFGRAANIIRAAGGYDGAAFFYVPSAESPGKAQTNQEPATESTRPEVIRRTTMSATSNSSSPGEESPDLPESQPDREGSSGDETGADSICPILGYSVSQEEEQVRGHYRLQFPQFLGRDMQRLLGSRPRGRVYLLDNAGAALPGDTSSSGSGADSSNLFHSNSTSSATVVHQKQHKGRKANQIKALRKLEPLAKAFICVPIWDYDRQRWFAFSIYWILNPTRDPAADRDLRFLQVFANSITNALSHLDAAEENRAKDSFVSSVSHELRSPLHGILGATNFLYDSNMGRFQREMVDTITSCGRTLLDSLEHVMDFAKINHFSKAENGAASKAKNSRKQQTELRRKKVLAASSLTSSVDISLVIEEVVEAAVLGFTVQHDFLHAEDALTETGVQLPNYYTKPKNLSNSHRTTSTRGRVRLCLDLPGSCVFETQPGAWRRIIMNLVGNALKYTEDGSIIISYRLQDGDVSVEGDSEDPAKSRQGSWLVFSVRDTGIGMSNEFMQNNVFKAFSQENSLAVGVGLGLSIVDQVVSSVGGHVEVASARGFGSTFSVHVPLPFRKDGKTTLAPSSRGLASIAERMNGVRVCILEDQDSKASLKNSDKALKAEDQFSQTLIRTLRDTLAIDAVVSSQFDSADLVICLEPSFRLLESVRSHSTGLLIPPMLFIAHDALEVAVLRADSRITDSESFVEVTYQPLGPRKLAAALIHCIDQSKVYSARNSTENLLSGKSRSLSHDSQENLAIKRSSTPVASPLGRESPWLSDASTTRKRRSIVLCVDDNPLNLRLLTTFIEKKKLPFVQAVNGREAARLIRRYETENSLSPVPIFALTGLASAAAKSEALEAGIDKIFTKPVPFSALTEILSLSQPPTTNLSQTPLTTDDEDLTMET